MGFDIYGQHAKNEDGEYFRNNVWWWRPLWELIVEVNKDVLTVAEAKAGQYNDGKLISKAKAKKITENLEKAMTEKEKWQPTLDKIKKKLTYKLDATGETIEYPFDWENVEKFVKFLKSSNGFRIY